MPKPPSSNIDVESLPVRAENRHEEFVDLFGQYIIWLRNWTNELVQERVNSVEAQQGLGTILRRPYEEAGKLPPNDRKRALDLAAASTDVFIKLLMPLLAHRGMDFPVGAKHAMRFRLEMEIVDRESDQVVHEEIINRGGKKHFGDYWGQWLNRSGK